jgi:hypothetical protein
MSACIRSGTPTSWRSARRIISRHTGRWTPVTARWPQKTKLLNDQGDAVSFDDYLPQGGGSDVFFGAVAEDSDTGSKSISVTLESGETVAVTLFQIHPDDHLTAGTPLVVYKTTGGYRAQPATWLA